jgi:ABC-type lipoprotein release transport system permease subunit
LTVGKLQDLASLEPPAVIVGDALAETLQVRVGDPVTMMLPKSVTQPSNGPTLAQTFRVTGIFHVDFDEYDERLAFASLTAVQKILNRGDQVMGIEFTVTAIDQSSTVARAIEQTLGGPRTCRWTGMSAIKSCSGPCSAISGRNGNFWVAERRPRCPR